MSARAGITFGDMNTNDTLVGWDNGTEGRNTGENEGTRSTLKQYCF